MEAYVKYTMFHAETKRKYVLSGTCITMPVKTIMYALWDSTWTDAAHGTPSQIWDTGQSWRYTELPTVRDVRLGGCVTMLTVTVGQ